MNFSIEPFVEAVKKGAYNVEGVIVWQDGQFLAHHQFIPEVRRNQFSVSKSFTSAAVGFAIQEGLISLEDRVVDHFPDRLPAEVNDNLLECRLKDLLCMAPGQDTDHLTPRMREGGLDDYISYTLSCPFTKVPGTYFWYNNAATYLAAVMVQKKAGCDLVDYLMPRLFTPLGMARPHWDTDPEGYSFGASGLHISVSELFRFIEMYYNYGRINGKQILDRDWIELSTTFKIDNAHYDPYADNHCGYCYCFWRGQHGSFRADGYHAKFGVVLRDLNAIICINSDEGRQQEVLDVMWDTIYPELQANR